MNESSGQVKRLTHTKVDPLLTLIGLEGYQLRVVETRPIPSGGI